MHYVISYDLESDRLREKCAKLLQRQGCNRIQKSVFVAPFLQQRDLKVLMTALQKLQARWPKGLQDSIIFFPLPDEQAERVLLLGNNIVFTLFEPLPLKIVL